MKPKTNRRLLLNLMVFTALLIVGIILFRNNFKFGLNSDENRLILTAKGNVHSIRSFPVFLQPYGGQLLTMFALNRLFDHDAQWYFITALIFRVIASFSIYLLGKFLFKNKFIALFAAFLFIVSYAGVQTSSPVNSNTYLSLALMNLGLIELFQHFAQKGKTLPVFDKKLILSYLLFFLAFIFSPIRMHGLVFLFIVIQISALFLKINRFVPSIFQTLLFLTMIFVIRKLGFTESVGTAAEVSRSLLNIGFLLKKTNPVNATFYMFNSFYQMLVVPEFNPLGKIFISLFANLKLGNQYTLIVLLLPSLLLTSASVLVMKSKKYLSVIPSFIWFFFLFTMRGIFSTTLSAEGTYMLFGGAITVIIFRLILVLSQTNRKLAFYLTALLAWPFCFILIPHIVWPGIPNFTVSRYFTIPVAGLTLLTSFLIIGGSGLIFRQTRKRLSDPRLNKFLAISIPSIIFAVIFINNFNIVRTFYEKEGERGLYAKYINGAFAIMNKEIGDRSDKKRPIVYLESDNSDFTFLSITDGGEERFSLLNNNLSENVRPFFVATYEDLSKILCRNKYVQFSPKIDDIFAFEVKDKQVFVETKKIRANLLKEGVCQNLL